MVLVGSGEKEKNNNTKIYKSNNDRWTLHDVKSSHGFWAGELGRH